MTTITSTAAAVVWIWRCGQFDGFLTVVESFYELTREFSFLWTSSRVLQPSPPPLSIGVSDLYSVTALLCCNTLVCPCELRFSAVSNCFSLTHHLSLVWRVVFYVVDTNRHYSPKHTSNSSSFAVFNVIIIIIWLVSFFFILHSQPACSVHWPAFSRSQMSCCCLLIVNWPRAAF